MLKASTAGAIMTITQSRRRFLESVGFAGAALAGSSWRDAARAAGGNPTPDLVVINAKVTTMDPAMPKAEAFAVRGGRARGFVLARCRAGSRRQSLAGPGGDQRQSNDHGSCRA